MRVTLSDQDRRFITRFEDETGATARDCLVYDDEDRVVFLVVAGEMAQAVGPDGRHVQAVEEALGRTVELVEDADTPEAFVANALAPAAVQHVTISEQGDRVAYAEVPEADRGAAIGRDGRNIETARRLARRHYDLDDVQLT
ncbi:NusA-like transcription termination signal-binding factor [Haloplanus aerogenes]|uniref:Probable transcription termination protein NusA n=1 Tax=Haloplanus aerogenes TaxID=660522 RepID=A0A3M0CSS7_9EURY|nr:NusA-like transcription termination signal-binding factor [Haloplanus aerogenes]AZH26921.1 NusA-like transcription termination signal-binding factor [Haloplanus aerogenes]RMB12572.1 N utilization substance protein A [Haloplanus aerogenes]